MKGRIPIGLMIIQPHQIHAPGQFPGVGAEIHAEMEIGGLQIRRGAHAAGIGGKVQGKGMILGFQGLFKHILREDGQEAFGRYEIRG